MVSILQEQHAHLFIVIDWKVGAANRGVFTFKDVLEAYLLLEEDFFLRWSDVGGVIVVFVLFNVFIELQLNEFCVVRLLRVVVVSSISRFLPDAIRFTFFRRFSLKP